jgi:hypothetical protein
MSIQVTCSKGCGHSVTVSDEMLEEAKTLGRQIDVSHDVCPTEEGAPQRRFRLRVVVQERREVERDGNNIVQWHTLASMGAEKEAGSFKLAVPMIQEELNNQWQRIVAMSSVIDEEEGGD